MTLFTSDIESADRNCLKHAAVSIGCALFLAFFGAVYEHFSHGVYNYFMIYAFAPALISGLLLLFALLRGRIPRVRTLFLMHAAAAAWTAGCIVTGIIRISGRDHALLPVFAVLGAVTAVLALLSYFREQKQTAEIVPPADS